MMEQLLNSWRERILSIVRIITAFMFMQHGGQKMFGFPKDQTAEYVFFSLKGVAGALEIFAGALILIGLFTRPAAFICSGLMAFAYFLVHAPRNFWPLNNGGELAIMFCFVFLYLVTSGGGAWSVDNLLKKRNS